MTNLDAAIAYFSNKLAHETDPSDVHAALEAGDPSFVLIDTRNEYAWNQGHARGAVHIDKSTFADRIPAEYPAGTQFVVYCWGPGCNGATRGALALAKLGYAAKEMIGGFEHWAREGLPVDSKDGDATRPADPLIAPVAPDGATIACDC